VVQQSNHVEVRIEGVKRVADEEDDLLHREALIAESLGEMRLDDPHLSSPPPFRWHAVGTRQLHQQQSCMHYGEQLYLGGVDHAFAEEAIIEQLTAELAVWSRVAARSGRRRRRRSE